MFQRRSKFMPHDMCLPTGRLDKLKPGGGVSCLAYVYASGLIFPRSCEREKNAISKGSIS